MKNVKKHFHKTLMHAVVKKCKSCPCRVSIANVPVAIADFVMVFQSELNAICSNVQRYPDVETGGTLFGHITRTGVPTIYLATEAGSNSVHGKYAFEPDLDYEETVADHIINGYALESIGTYHSHHHLGLSHPSQGDIETVSRFWQKLPASITKYLMVIASIDERERVHLAPFLFDRSTPHATPRQLKWYVAPDPESPFSELRNRGCHE